MNLKISILFLLLFCGCEKLSQKVSSSSNRLPPNAINVEYLNDKWGKFELNGQSYYFSCLDTSETWVYFPINPVKEETTPKEKTQKQFRCPNCGVQVVITDLGPVHVEK